MKRFGLGMLAGVVAAIAVALAITPASAASSSVNVKWDTQEELSLTLTPNYFTGFGSVKAVFGTQPAPTHGTNAILDGGTVDFGTIEAGFTYIYKYAAHVNVTSNDPSGFQLFGQGASQFIDNTNSAGNLNLNTTLFYANSTSGSPADGNTGFSPSFPFSAATSGVTGGGESGPAPTINYGGSYPAAIGTSANASADFYYDYVLKVPVTAPSTPTSIDQYYVWVVYTAVGN